MRNLRPPLASAFSSFGVSALVTPVGGSPVTVVVVRMGPSVANPGIVADPSVMDTRPRFRLRRSEVASLPIGSTIAIANGPDSGTFTVERTESLDPEILQVVAEAA